VEEGMRENIFIIFLFASIPIATAISIGLYKWAGKNIPPSVIAILLISIYFLYATWFGKNDETT
jgi:hypothetical protein